MTLGIPSEFSFQGSTVKDITTTLDDLMRNGQSPLFHNGLELRHDDWIYEYTGEVNFTPPKYSTAAGTEYFLDQIIFKDGGLVKVTGKTGGDIVDHTRPKEPEEYGAWDTDLIDYPNWSHRYLRVASAVTNPFNAWLPNVWLDETPRLRYVLFWSNVQNTYVWQINDYWNEESYSQLDHSIKYSSKYDSTKDIKARIIDWGAIGRRAIMMESLIARGDYYYIRTTVDAPLEYTDQFTTITDYSYSFMDIVSPADIDGFVLKRIVNQLAPLDGKNYTETVFDTTYTNGKAVWTLVATKDFDSIAFGRVSCDSIGIKVIDANGNTSFELTDYLVDNTVSKGSALTFPSTIILYLTDLALAGDIVQITLSGLVISVGELLPAAKLDAGFTKMSFTNSFEDFSPKEQDQWGNWEYINGVKVHVHSGIVDFPLMDYDKLNRLMIMIGGQKVVINSSDSTLNEVADSSKVFSATMMIARFTSLRLESREEDKRIGDIASYTFDLEELV